MSAERWYENNTVLGMFWERGRLKKLWKYPIYYNAFGKMHSVKYKYLRINDFYWKYTKKV
jgi:hypothetical protein